ncbi:MAG: hypothetical protein A3A33_04445 [Candidatus Yanofskybacteria bacterium RIFCSPLOWO2_01_FULL_49_25]|uniref:Uncharacterized protein n=1 Tax=Candidatus Yanofskybacteria bacterium RIFCSPLOWO2_01_FULL_49_25 TaxID=1802701 RepID=A0A1F8GWC9_9BACT|nr:MAG: hypothetical protein A3A33_04445 [Candidatus Yanofskybacteria bacterium RIFCSPLOWO2_01_FULL_49_25]
MVKSTKKEQKAVEEKNFEQHFKELRTHLEHVLEDKINEVHQHLDDEMDELFETLTDELHKIGHQIDALQRLEKLEKRVADMDAATKRFNA